MMRWVAFAAVVGSLLWTARVEAKKYDLDPELARLYNHYDSGDSAQDALDRTTAYRSLMSEYGVVFAPGMMSPAETVGYSGFALDLVYGFTTANSKSEYWKYGVAGSPSSIMQTVGLQFRKGMWFPIPGFEIAGGIKYLASSHMYSPYLMGKFALNEGYFDLPVPALAVRGGLARVMGSVDMDMTVASFDVSLSKSVGLGGTINAVPYMGYNYLVIIADSKVIDTTPGIDALGEPPEDGGYPPGTLCSGDDCKSNVVFDDQSGIGRHRIFFGVKLTYHVFTFGLEMAWTLSGDSKDSAVAYDYASQQAANFNVRDESSFQQSYMFTLGADW